MNSRNRIITLGVASATAILAALFARDFIAGGAPAPKVVVQKAAREEVLVVKQDLRFGDKLQPANLEWRPWPRDDVLPGMIVRNDRPDAIAELANKSVRAPMVAGEPLLENKLTNASGGMLAGLLGREMRAVTIRLNPDNFASAAIKPGDRVDVMFTGSASNQKYTELVLENARVLPTDEASADGDGSGVSGSDGNLTLEVTPRQAAVLMRLQSVGELSVALRPSTGNEDAIPRLAPKYAKSFAGEVKFYRFGVPGSQTVSN